MKRLKRSPFVTFVREMAEIYFSRRIARAAAALAFFLVLTLFPVLICVNNFLGVLHSDLSVWVAGLRRFFPADTLQILQDYLFYVGENQSPAMLAAGLMSTVLCASAAFRTLMSTMDEIYRRKSYTGLWQVVLSVVFSLVFLLAIYCSSAVVLSGDWLFHLAERFFGISEELLPWRWQWLRFLLMFAMMFLVVLMVYRLAAPRGKPRPPLFTGALLAAVCLVGATALFSWFITLSARTSLVYGTIASVVILLLWLYLCGNILLLGGVFNCVRYRYKKIRYLRELHEMEEQEKEK